MLVRNSELGRSLLLRLRDSRVVWQTFYIADQARHRIAA
jgi:hypothetical protein